MLFFFLIVHRFILSHTLGIVATVIYAAFLTLSILFELNIFFVVNLPTCLSDKWAQLGCDSNSQSIPMWLQLPRSFCGALLL